MNGFLLPSPPKKDKNGSKIIYPTDAVKTELNGG